MHLRFFIMFRQSFVLFQQSVHSLPTKLRQCRKQLIPDRNQNSNWNPIPDSTSALVESGIMTKFFPNTGDDMTRDLLYTAYCTNLLKVHFTISHFV